eukprot:1407-Heterococcus_DN1.PRE.1
MPPRAISSNLYVVHSSQQITAATALASNNMVIQRLLYTFACINNAISCSTLQYTQSHADVYYAARAVVNTASACTKQQSFPKQSYNLCYAPLLQHDLAKAAANIKEKNTCTLKSSHTLHARVRLITASTNFWNSGCKPVSAASTGGRVRALSQRFCYCSSTTAALCAFNYRSTSCVNAWQLFRLPYLVRETHVHLRKLLQQGCCSRGDWCSSCAPT